MAIGRVHGVQLGIGGGGRPNPTRYQLRDRQSKGAQIGTAIPDDAQLIARNRDRANTFRQWGIQFQALQPCIQLAKIAIQFGNGQRRSFSISQHNRHHPLQ
jgi:hypothetical protein